MDARHLTGALVIHALGWNGSEIVLDASGAADQGRCPTCGVASTYVHDRYVRRPRDLPWRGRRVRLNLIVRRFRCQNTECPRHTFAEDFGAALDRYAHYTAEAEAMLLPYGRTAGGEGGAVQAACAGLPASGDTLVRLLRRSVATPAVIPHVLGVDEFSLARRHRYGTVLVDLQRHEAIDLLDGHKAEPVAAWLRDHPSVEVFVRDRAGAFSDAARQGAPDAIQVADRFHLLQNASQALDELLRRGRRRRIEHAVIHAQPPPATTPAVPARPLSKERLRSEAARPRRVGRWELVRARHAAGQSVSRIARDLGMSRMTVRHLLRTPEPPPPIVMPRPGGLRSPVLQPDVSYLQDRWQAGCTNFAQLTREIRALGSAGSGSLVSQALLPWRPPRPPRGSKPQRRRRKHSYSVRWLCLRPPAQLEPDERAALDQVVAEDEEVARGYRLLQPFRQVVADRSVAALDQWLREAETSELAPFVSLTTGLRDESGSRGGRLEPAVVERSDGGNSDTNQVGQEARIRACQAGPAA